MRHAPFRIAPLALIALASTLAHAQPAPGALGAPGAPGTSAQDWTPFITEGDERLWSLRAVFAASREYERDIYARNTPIHRRAPWGNANPGGAGGLGNRRVDVGPYQTIDVKAATFVAPVQWRSASSEAFPSHLEGMLEFNGADITDEWIGQPSTLPDLVGVEWSVRLADDQGNTLVPFINQPERVDIDFRIPVRTHETVFDEQRAMEVDWPAQWPDWTQPFREPQSHIASDDRFVGMLLNDWTDNAPRSVPPARLAKALAARLIDTVQPVGEPRAFWPVPDEIHGGYPYVVSRRSTGPFFRGFDVQDPRIFYQQVYYSPRIREPVEETRANAAVTTNLYVALLRNAGIPARVIIGVLPIEAELSRIGGRDTLPASNDQRAVTFRFWAEFYLWDEHARRGQWIPVDIARQREESSRSRPLDQEWRYFGNHDELDEIVPISSVYAPENAEPINSVPALWGWRPEPTPAIPLDAVIRFEVTGAVRRPGDPFGEIGVKRGGR